MLSLALMLAAAAAPDTAAPRAAPAQDAPAVTVHHQPALPVVALRLSLLADDPPGYAGAGHFFQHLFLPSLQEQAARVGARVQAVRSSDAVVYSVIGPASELSYLAGLLRGALRPPTPGSPELLAALGALAEERAAERETAPSYVRAALRSRLFPADLPPAGTEAAAARLETARLADLWGELYRPERVSVIAVGDVELEAVQRAFRDLPAAPGGGVAEAVADTLPAVEADTPQATRGWIGVAYPAPEADAAAMSVTARLLQSGLRRRMTRSQVDVEHWWTHHGQALALVVATPDSLVPAARRTVGSALEWLGQNLREAGVRDAALAVRRDMLFFSRTPERMAEVLGEFADRGGDDPDAAQRFYAALETVTADDVRRVLAILREQEAATIYVPAQRIPEAQRRR